jgi:hypothetical protein
MFQNFEFITSHFRIFRNFAENERAPQVICMAPAIPLPAPWNLKAKDTTESFRYFKSSGWENYIEASPSIATATDRVKIGIFWAAIGPEAMSKCEDEWIPL